MYVFNHFTAEVWSQSMSSTEDEWLRGALSSRWAASKLFSVPGAQFIAGMAPFDPHGDPARQGAFPPDCQMEKRRLREVTELAKESGFPALGLMLVTTSP